MKIVADTHVHLYPCHVPESLFSCEFRNLARFDKEAVKLLFMTESTDCHYFRDMREGRAACPLPGTLCEVGDEGEVIVLKRGPAAEMYVFAGRQIVTSERLEVLALTLDRSFADGEPAAATIRSVLEAGGVPVLAWAPGKWLFGRGRTVERLLELFRPGELLIGDTSLRPAPWPEPGLMRRARRSGLAVLAGSDPLPLPGEEIIAGSFATLLEIDFDGQRPVASIRTALRTPGVRAERVGRRCGLLEAASRLRKHMLGSH